MVVRTKTDYCGVVGVVVMTSMTFPVDLAVVAVWRDLKVGGDYRRMSVHYRMGHFRRHMRVGQAHLQGLERKNDDEQVAQHGCE